MISRDVLRKCDIGDYCELIVGAAFIAERADVAFPFGNQYKWDIVVREKGSREWLTVQVKTLSRLTGGEDTIVDVHMQDRKKSAYTKEDIDLLTVVHPETGTMWKVPIEEFSGKKRLHLADRFIWHGNVTRDRAPLCERKHALNVGRNKDRLKDVHEAAAIDRSPIRNSLPINKPDDMGDHAWEMVNRWCRGEGYKAIGSTYGISHCAVRDRLIRSLRRLGAKGLPVSFEKPIGRSFSK